MGLFTKLIVGDDTSDEANELISASEEITKIMFEKGAKCAPVFADAVKNLDVSKLDKCGSADDLGPGKDALDTYNDAVHSNYDNLEKCLPKDNMYSPDTAECDTDAYSAVKKALFKLKDDLDQVKEKLNSGPDCYKQLSEEYGAIKDKLDGDCQ